MFPNSRFIFNFHDISDPGSPQYSPVYSTPVDVFKEQLSWISKRFRIVSLDELHTPAKNGPLAAITFDDGWQSVYDHAFPILNKAKITFSVFLNRQAIEQNWIWCNNVLIRQQQNDQPFLEKLYSRLLEDPEAKDKEIFMTDPAGYLLMSTRPSDYPAFYDEKLARQKFYMDKSEVLALLEAGITVGSHTVSHAVLSRCNDSELAREIHENADYLENLTGQKITHFAIPFGFPTTYDERLIQLVKERHDYIYTTDRAPLNGRVLTPRIGLASEKPEDLRFFINKALLTNLKHQRYGNWQ